METSANCFCSILIPLAVNLWTCLTADIINFESLTLIALNTKCVVIVAKQLNLCPFWPSRRHVVFHVVFHLQLAVGLEGVNFKACHQVLQSPDHKPFIFSGVVAMMHPRLAGQWHSGTGVADPCLRVKVNQAIPFMMAKKLPAAVIQKHREEVEKLWNQKVQNKFKLVHLILLLLFVT